MIQLSVGMKVQLKAPLQAFNGEVIYHFPAGVRPDAHLVEKYYQLDHMDAEYKKLFSVCFHSQLTDRWVVQRTDGEYIVIPENHQGLANAIELLKE